MCAQDSTWAICLFVYFFENWRLAFSKVCRTWPAHLELILYIGHKESQEESRDRSKLTSSRIFCLKMLHIICNFEYVSISALQWVDILTVTIILHNVDVLCSQTFLKRYCNHFSVIYLSSTLHVSALALFTCDMQLNNNLFKDIFGKCSNTEQNSSQIPFPSEYRFHI